MGPQPPSPHLTLLVDENGLQPKQNLRKFSTFLQNQISRSLQKCCWSPPSLPLPASPLPPPFTELRGRRQEGAQSAQQPRRPSPVRRARASQTRWRGRSPPRCSTTRSSASSTAPSTAQAVLTLSMGWPTTLMSLASL